MNSLKHIVKGVRDMSDGNMSNSQFLEAYHPRAKEGDYGGQFIDTGQEPTVKPPKRLTQPQTPILYPSNSYKIFRTPTDAHNWGTKEFQQTLSQLNEEGFATLKSFSESRFLAVNSFLRNEEASQPVYVRETIFILDRILASSTLTEPIVLWRGMNSSAVYKNIDNMDGRRFTDAGYTSASLLPEVAEEHLGRFGILVQVRIPQGFHGLYIESLTEMEEYEIILPRNITFKVTGTDDDGRIKHLIVEPV